MNPVRPDGSLSRRAQVKELRRFASERASGAGEFGTVLVAASYDGFPVPAFLHYLAPYYMNFDLALEKAERILGPDAALRRVYFLGLAGQYFEFVGRRGTVLLDCKTLSEESLEELRGAAPHAPPPEETPVSLENRRRVKAELAREWDKVKAQIGANRPRGR